MHSTTLIQRISAVLGKRAREKGDISPVILPLSLLNSLW